jgi:hypothetical protein
MKQTSNTNSQKLNLQKKTIKKLSTASMFQIQGGASAPATTPPPPGTR